MPPNMHYNRYLAIKAARKIPMSARDYAERWVGPFYRVQQGEATYRTRCIDVVCDAFPHVERGTIKNWLSISGTTPEYAGYMLALMDVVNHFIYGETIDGVTQNL